MLKNNLNTEGTQKRQKSVGNAEKFSFDFI